MDRGDEGRKRLGEAVSRLEDSVEDLEASRAQAWPSRTSQAWACSRTAASQPNKYTKSTFITSQFRPDIDQVPSAESNPRLAPTPHQQRRSGPYRAAMPSQPGASLSICLSSNSSRS